MGEESRIRSRHFGRAWVDLLESEASPNAKLCYVVMTSFHPSDRPKLEAIARRMGVNKRTARRAQQELTEGNWLRLDLEAKNGNPREWTVNDPGDLRGSKNDTLELDLRGSKKDTQEDEGGSKTRGSKKDTLKALIEREPKELDKTLKPFDEKRGTFLGLFKTFFPTYKISGHDAKEISSMLRQESCPTEAEWVEACLNFEKDKSPYTQRHSLYILARKPNYYLRGGSEQTGGNASTGGKVSDAGADKGHGRRGANSGSLTASERNLRGQKLYLKPAEAEALRREHAGVVGAGDDAEKPGGKV